MNTEENFLPKFIEYLQGTAEDSWQTDTVRSKDGSKNCMFGHLFNYGGSDEESSRLWDMFEECIATTYMIYPVNDGKNPRYPQATPKQRVIKYLENILAGDEETTHQCGDRCMAEHNAKKLANVTKEPT